jgi:hypothetical protein
VAQQSLNRRQKKKKGGKLDFNSNSRMSTLTLELMKERSADLAAVPTIFENDGNPIDPCPFCDSLSLTIRHDPEIECTFWMHCLECHAEGPIAPSRRFAVKKWQSKATAT